jgi:alkylation response protein AidB-like acyl-CoA dehydrogenase
MTRINLLPETPDEPTAHVIETDAEALAVARSLATVFAAGAAERDRQGVLPRAEIDRFSQSGLWGAIVPRAWGGAGIALATLVGSVRSRARCWFGDRWRIW